MLDAQIVGGAVRAIDRLGAGQARDGRAVAGEADPAGAGPVEGAAGLLQHAGLLLDDGFMHAQGGAVIERGAQGVA